MNPAVGYQGQVPMPLPVYRDVWPGLIFPPRARPTKQHAAIAYVAGTSGTVATGTTLTVNKPTGTADGDGMILVLAHNATISGVTLSGWSQIYSDDRQKVLVRVASSEGSSYAPTWTTSTHVVGTLSSWSGVDSDFAMAYHGNGASTGASPIPVYSPLFFQACDYVVVSSISRLSNAAVTVPSGWTTGPSGTTSNNRGHQAYLAVSNTQGYGGGHSWTTGVSTTTTVFTIALRGASVTVLSVKSVNIGYSGSTRTGWQLASASTSMALTMPNNIQVGNLIVVLQMSRVNTSGSDITFGTPSGYTKKGTDQPYNVGTNRFTCGVLYRVATGSDACTVTTSVSCTIGALVMLFSTGSTGDDAGLPGTMGQITDSTADSTAAIAAMTLEDYAENNFVFAYVVLETGFQPGLTVPSGFTYQNAAGGGTVAVSGYVAVKVNGGADPGATTWGTANNFRSVSDQFAVGVVLDGAGANETTQAILI